ncbi:caspase family protein [Saccharomonospora iraqiensis]|uniref:caspase family protein n=1 Tax=Saccharomonospora iraqiensis TaxID=52698 RepID=UPI00022E0B37|nr:caspase family protein [Saccharomonospora iraqiensis]
MTGHALLIGNGTYTDPTLRRLRSPAQDVDALAAVLGDPDVGDYSVRTLVDTTAAELASATRNFFADREPGDVLVLYFSGHGVKDAAGELFLGATDTRLDDLDAGAVSTDELNRWIAACRSRHILLILDCCYSGAFPRGMVAKADPSVRLQERFGRGRGLAILTASTAVEYAFEGSEVRDGDPDADRGSVFTAALIEALHTGAADDDFDQRITLDELYYYVFERVRVQRPDQTPCWWLLGGQDLFVVARRRPGTTARRPIRTEPAPPHPLAPRRAAALWSVPWGVAGTGLLSAALLAPAPWRLSALALLGILMLAAAVGNVVGAGTGRVTVTDDGVTVAAPLPSTVRWPAIVRIETYRSPFGRRAQLRRADDRWFSRLPLPVPRSGLGGVDRARFTDEVRTLQRRAHRAGSPVEIHDLGWAPQRGRALASAALVAVAVLAVDRPWTWEFGPLATDVPDACEVLDEEAVDGLIDSMLSLAVMPQRLDAQSSADNARCSYGLSVLLFNTQGTVTLNYDLVTATPNRSATGEARRRFAAPGLEDVEGLGFADEVGTRTEDDGRTRIVRARCANVLTSGELAVENGELGTAVAEDNVTDLVEKAVRALEPGLC